MTDPTIQRERARSLVRLVAGTMALDGLALSEPYKEMLIERTIADLDRIEREGRPEDRPSDD